MEQERNVRSLDLMEFISKDMLEDLYLKQKLSDAEIGKKFNVSLGRVHRLRNRYNIDAIEYYERHPKQELSEREKAFMAGHLLGDGHIRLRENKNNRSYPEMMVEQSVKHRQYLYWLFEEMKDWVCPESTNPVRENRKYNKKKDKYYHSLSFQSIAHPVFSEFLNGFYLNRVKIIDINFIEKYFTDLSLAVWYMDDGFRAKRGRRSMFATNGYTLEECHMLKDFLEKKYGMTGHLKKCMQTRQITYELGLDIKSSEKLTSIIEKYIVPDMKYKLVSLSETTNGAELKVLKV